MIMKEISLHDKTQYSELKTQNSIKHGQNY